MTKPRASQTKVRADWTKADDARLCAIMHGMNDGLPPGRGGQQNFWLQVAVAMGLGATTSASRRVRRRWAALAPGAPSRGKAATLQLDLARGACDKDADPRDVLALYGALTNHGDATALVDQAFGTLSEAGAEAEAEAGDDPALVPDADVDLDALEQLCCAEGQTVCNW